MSRFYLLEGKTGDKVFFKKIIYWRIQKLNYNMCTCKDKYSIQIKQQIVIVSFFFLIWH